MTDVLLICPPDDPQSSMTLVACDFGLMCALNTLVEEAGLGGKPREFAEIDADEHVGLEPVSGIPFGSAQWWELSNAEGNAIAMAALHLGFTVQDRRYAYYPSGNNGSGILSGACDYAAAAGAILKVV